MKKKKQLKWYKKDDMYSYGYIDANGIFVNLMSIFTDKGVFELAINGQWHNFKKLTTAKKVGELIFKG